MGKQSVSWAGEGGEGWWGVGGWGGGGVRGDRVEVERGGGKGGEG